MICSDGIRALIVLIIAGLSWVHLLQVWHLIGLSLTFGLVRGFFRPAYKAIQAEIVQKQDLPSANALTDFGTQMRQLLGPMLGAMCIALAGPAVAFAFDGLTFLISTLCLLGVHMPTQQNMHPSQELALSLHFSRVSWKERRPGGIKKVVLRPYEQKGVAQLAPLNNRVLTNKIRCINCYAILPSYANFCGVCGAKLEKSLTAWSTCGVPKKYKEREPENWVERRNSSHKLAWRLGLKKIRLDIVEGLGYVMSSKWLWVSILIACVFNIGWMGPLFVALPKLVHDVYHAEAWLIGMLVTASALGSICASLFVGQMSRLRRRGLTSYLSLIFPCAGLIILGLPLPPSMAPLIASLAQVLLGLGLGVFNTIWATVLQELVPNDKLGRVSSIDALSSFSLLPIGYALIGILTDTIGPRWVFLTCGTFNVLLVAVGLSVREIRQMS
jgi:MFS family permease